MYLVRDSDGLTLYRLQHKDHCVIIDPFFGKSLKKLSLLLCFCTLDSSNWLYDIFVC